MVTIITVCDSCRGKNWNAEIDLKRDGEKLAELVEEYAKGNSELKVKRHSCVMGCQRACNIVIQGDIKVAYVLDKFTPCKEHAQAIVEYASLHAKSETGQVAFKSWPKAIKGHFVARLPIFEPTKSAG